MNGRGLLGVGAATLVASAVLVGTLVGVTGPAMPKPSHPDGGCYSLPCGENDAQTCYCKEHHNTRECWMKAAECEAARR